jgi:hypothetical protein
MIGENNFIPPIGEQPEEKPKKKMLPVVCKWCGKKTGEKEWEGREDLDLIAGSCEECNTRMLREFKEAHKEKID